MASESVVASRRAVDDGFAPWFAVAKGLYAGLSAAALVSAAARAVGAAPDAGAVIVAVLLVAPVYAFDACRDRSPQRGVQVLLFGSACALVAVACAKHATTALASSAVLLCVGYAYAAWLKPFTRAVPAFKTVLVAFCWAMLVPLAGCLARRPFGIATITTALFFFVQLAVNVAICDLKDIGADRRAGLRTCAIVLGADRLRSIAEVLNVLSAALIVVAIEIGALPQTGWRLLPFCAWTVAAIVAAKRRRSELFHTLVIDGTLLWPALSSWLADGVLR